LRKILNKDLKEVTRASSVIDRMEEFQRIKNTKIQQRKRDLTPKFKPRVLENFQSRRKNKKSTKLKEEKFQQI